MKETLIIGIIGVICFVIFTAPPPTPCQKWRTVTSVDVFYGGLFHDKPLFTVKYDDGKVDVQDLEFSHSNIGDKECSK